MSIKQFIHTSASYDELSAIASALYLAGRHNAVHVDPASSTVTLHTDDGDDNVTFEWDAPTMMFKFSAIGVEI